MYGAVDGALWEPVDEENGEVDADELCLEHSVVFRGSKTVGVVRSHPSSVDARGCCSNSVFRLGSVDV